MKYISSLIELKNTVESAFNVQEYRFQLFVVFIVFVAVYRWRLNSKIYLKYPRFKKVKAIYCEPCFGFWLAFLISGNVLTAATAFLIFQFYEKN